MAIWLWIYDNDFALCNWNIAQPRIKKYLCNNFLSERGVVLFFFLCIHGEKSSNYTMQIDTINQSCIQMQSYDTEEAGVEFSQCSFVCLSEGLWMSG